MILPDVLAGGTLLGFMAGGGSLIKITTRQRLLKHNMDSFTCVNRDCRDGAGMDVSEER